MPRRDPAEPNRGTLPTASAERLLERASHLEAARAGEVSVAELRAAAAEAGISAASFEAALAELEAGEAQLAPRSGRPARRRVPGWIAGAVVTGVLAVAVFVTFAVRIPVAASPVVPMVEEAILLRCLTPGEAGELVRSLVLDRASTVRSGPATAPRVIVVRTTPAQMERVKAVLAKRDGADGGACAVPASP